MISGIYPEVGCSIEKCDWEICGGLPYLPKATREELYVGEILDEVEGACQTLNCDWPVCLTSSMEGLYGPTFPSRNNTVKDLGSVGTQLLQ